MLNRATDEDDVGEEEEGNNVEDDEDEDDDKEEDNVDDIDFLLLDLVSRQSEISEFSEVSTCFFLVQESLRLLLTIVFAIVCLRI